MERAFTERVVDRSRPADWGVTTQKANQIYVHVLQWKAPLLALSPIEKTINSAQEFRAGSAVEFKQTKDGVVLKLPPVGKGELDRVIVLSVAP